MRVTNEFRMVEFEEMGELHGEYETLTVKCEDGKTAHTYQFADGAIWYETVQKMSEEVPVEAHGIKLGTVTVDLIKVDYLRSDKTKRRHVYIQDSDPELIVNEEETEADENTVEEEM